MPDMRERADRPNVGLPDFKLIATLAERPSGCQCTWVVHQYDYTHRGNSTYRLKYMTSMCPDRLRHFMLEKAA